MSQYQQINNREYSYQETPFYDYRSAENSMVSSADRMAKDSRLTARREKTAKIFRIIIAVLLFVIFVQVMYHLYFARNIRIEKIEIECSGELFVGDRQILEMAGLTGSESYFGVEPEVISSRLARYPQVASAVVEKKFPDTLRISLAGREALAVCLIETDSRVIPAAVDEKGVIFQVGRAVTELNLPVISGIRIDEARLGSVLPQAVSGFLDSLGTLRAESPSFFNSVSEFRLVRKSNDDFDVLMYPQNYSIPVRIGSRIDRELFTYIVLVLDVAEGQGMSGYLEELDFRTDEVVYRVKGE